LFTGRRVDILDSGSLKIQYNRNRYYDYYTGRWLTEDPLEYLDSVNLYLYALSNPVVHTDPDGLRGRIRGWIIGLGCRRFRRLHAAAGTPGLSGSERIRRIRRLYRFLGRWGRFGGSPHAARIMRHWLSGAASDISIPKSLILSVSEGVDAHAKLRDKVKDEVWCSVGITPTFSEYVDTPTGTDLYYATGYFHLKAYGKYSESWWCSSCERKLKIYFSMRDPYDWHTGLGVSICGVRVPDDWARDLGIADGLSTFDVYAKWKEKAGCVPCKCK